MCCELFICVTNLSFLLMLSAVIPASDLNNNSKTDKYDDGYDLSINYPKKDAPNVIFYVNF